MKNKAAVELGRLGGNRTAANGTNSFANGGASSAASTRWAAMSPADRSEAIKRTWLKRKRKDPANRLA